MFFAALLIVAVLVDTSVRLSSPRKQLQNHKHKKFVVADKIVPWSEQSWVVGEDRLADVDVDLRCLLRATTDEA